ncbi:RidA family protein [Nodosilinea sp. LEGE 07298]|uniref:RidA family protein n=1 Tax=Nodosilinea sp. LEGE 07298 TaxID=2777970 RepID=UPI0018826EA3|nr:RidA family protein [Nodosilinea sp. LEGE 07298]MBE9113213.1 RidA family protein [Nodosilinea sp. LEGE 07298]
MVRQRAFSGTPWEEKVGYCRTLRVGQQIFVSGTAPSDGEGNTFAPGDAYAQTHRCFEIIQQALEDLGANLSDVVRTRVYITDMNHWPEVARAHHELFADHPPVNTTVEIPALMNPDMLVEIEVEALCEETSPQKPLAIRSQNRTQAQPQSRPQNMILGRPIQPASLPPVTASELDEGCLD